MENQTSLSTKSLDKKNDLLDNLSQLPIEILSQSPSNKGWSIVDSIQKISSSLKKKLDAIQRKRLIPERQAEKIVRELERKCSGAVKMYTE